MICYIYINIENIYILSIVTTQMNTSEVVNSILERVSIEVDTQREVNEVDTLLKKLKMYQYIDLFYDGLERTLPPELQASCDFCADNCSGNEPSVSQIANNAANASTVKNLLTTTQWGSNNSQCMDCHSGSAGRGGRSSPSPYSVEALL